jgi:hypothetical protein
MENVKNTAGRWSRSYTNPRGGYPSQPGRGYHIPRGGKVLEDMPRGGDLLHDVPRGG